jgi:uncharacterized protein DUF4352
MNNYPNGPQQPYQQPGGYPSNPGYPPYPPPGYQQPPMQQPKKKLPIFKIGCGTIVGLVVLFIIIAIASGGKSNTGTPDKPAAGNTGNTTNSQPAASTQHFKPGDTVKVGDTWQVTISNVRSVPAGQYDSLKSGDIYLGVDVNFKNISSTEASLFGNADWTLKDTQGQKYDNAYVSDFPNPPDGKVEAGAPAKGSLIFEVPASIHNFQLAYEQNMFESGQTIWDISVS